MNELKEERKKLREALYTRIDQVTRKNDLDQIAKKVIDLNNYLDDKDTKLENALDSISNVFTATQKTRIKKFIDDILDKYDQVKKDGTPYYSASDKEKILSLVREIDEICSRNFWDRFVTVWSIGS
jgi:hypothetical protein